MTRGKPMLDLKRELKGATPESLARALLKAPYRPLAARRAGKSVVSDEVAVEEPTTDHAGDGITHLSEDS